MPWIRKPVSRTDFSTIALICFVIGFMILMFLAAQNAAENDLDRRARRIEIETQERILRKARERDMRDKIGEPADRPWDEPFTMPPSYDPSNL